VLGRAEEILKEMAEEEAGRGGGVTRYTQMLLIDEPAREVGDHPLLERIREMDLDTLTPRCPECPARAAGDAPQGTGGRAVTAVPGTPSIQVLDTLTVNQIAAGRWWNGRPPS